MGWFRRHKNEAAAGAPRRSRAGVITGTASISGALVLCFVGGAAVMHFRLFPYDRLHDAFVAAQAWREAERSDARRPPGDLPEARVSIDRAGRTFDGFTLYTTNAGPEATLIDMAGRVVHRWTMPAARGKAGPARPVAHWERCHLYPNGDVLALCCENWESPYGQGVAKLDKDSNLLWYHEARVHHDLDVGEDGKIYVPSYRRLAGAAAGGSPRQYTVESVLVLSPEGKRLDEVPLLDVFQNTPYFLTLTSANEGAAQAGGPVAPAMPGQPPAGESPRPEVESGDVIHANSVKVLTKALAPRFPGFKAGQLLLSLRTPDVICVLDLESRSVVWAGRRQCQHDAHFLENGTILLFDNFGSGRGARVLEYDPRSYALPWAYPGYQEEGFSCAFRGCTGRLPNGNTLVVNSCGLTITEVARDGELVWQWGMDNGPHPAGPSGTD